MNNGCQKTEIVDEAPRRPGSEVLDVVPPEVLGDIVDVHPLSQQGGFSNLFYGHKVGLDTDVVIKRVRRDYRGRMDEQSEARILISLRHQYLPRVYDFKRASDGYCYTVMEKIEGGTLREYVEARGALDQRQALRWTRQLCEVIDYMHRRRPRGIIHSDLKPENVMVTPEGDICVIDFNASLEAAEEGGRDAIGLTPGYAAPEQFNVPLERFAPDHPRRRAAAAAQSYGKVTFRTDLYAIGALAYYMLTGYDPQLWVDGVIPLNRYQIVLGDAFRAVIEKAMTPDPRGRYPSAAAMLRALNNLTVLDKRYRSWRRQATAAALAVGVGLAMGVFTVFLGFRALQNERSGAYLTVVEQARSLQQQGSYDESADLLLQAVAMEPRRIEAYLELGSLLYREGEYQQAVDLLDGIEFQPGSLSEHAFAEAEGQEAYLLANCYYELEDYDKALTNYQLAVYFIPDQPEYQCELAICYAKTNNQQMARDLLATLQQTDCPEELLARVQGEIDYANGDYETAYESLSRAASLSEGASAARCYIQAANCCPQLGTGWVGTEIQLLQTAVTRLDAANSSILLQMLAEAYISQGAQPGVDTAACYEQALACLQQLLDRGYATFAIRQNQAVVLEYLNRYAEAEEVLTAMLRDFPQDYRVPMRLALLYVDEASANDDDAARRVLYAQAAEQYAAADALYEAAAEQDSEMLRLQELMAQLQAAGWL